MKQILNKWHNITFIERTLKVESFFNGLYFKKKWKNAAALVRSLALAELPFFENGSFTKLHLLKYQSFKLWVADQVRFV